MEQLCAAELGYGLMCVGGTKNDLGRGPELICQVYNPRPINPQILKKIENNKQSHGLLNRHESNAISVGIKKTFIKGGLQGRKSEAFCNRVQWASNANASGNTMMLFNGNHRCTHIAESYEQEFYSWNIATTDAKRRNISAREKNDAQVIIKNTQNILDQHAIWLVKFYDIGER